MRRRSRIFGGMVSLYERRFEAMLRLAKDFVRTERRGR